MNSECEFDQHGDEFDQHGDAQSIILEVHMIFKNVFSSSGTTQIDLFLIVVKSARLAVLATGTGRRKSVEP